MRVTGRKASVYVVALLLAFAAHAGTGGALAGESEQYPARDIKFVVPFRPGGGLDIQARLLAPYIAKNLPRRANVVVVNESAAGGKVGALMVMVARPDGYTLGLLPPTQLGVLDVLGELGKRDPATLAYFARVGYAPYMLLRSARSRLRSIAEMRGQEVRFGGTTAVIFQAALLAQQIGAKMTFVTYDGLPETALAAMRGDVDVFFFNWDSSIRHLRASEGRLVPLMVAAESRLHELPDVPTSREIGLTLSQGVLDTMAAGNMVVGQAALQPDVRQVLERTITQAINDPALEAELQKAGYSTKPALLPAQSRATAIRVYETIRQHKDLLLETVRR